MHIVLAIIRYIVIDHQVDGIDVDTATENIRRHQQRNTSAGKCTQHILPLRLLQITMDLSHIETLMLQLTRKLFDRMLAAAENQGIFIGDRLEYMSDHRIFLRLIHHISALTDLIRRTRNRNVHLNRFMQNSTGQLTNLFRHGSRKK